MTVPIRLALIGLGKMGTRWLSVIRESPRFDLVAVVDPAAPVGALRSLALAPSFDAAIVATPTPTHYALAYGLLTAGVHVLVEKPLAANYNDARALVDAAATAGARLAVGHVERFNPAARALFDVVRSGAIGFPLRAGAIRQGPRPATVAPGNDVALDLAVHDLDLFRAALGPLRIDFAAPRIDGDDLVTIGLQTQPGLSVTTRAAWQGDKMRFAWVTGDGGTAKTDLLAQTLTVNGAPVPVEAGNALAAQLAAFARLIDGEDAAPLCSGEDGAAAVLLAERAMRGETGENFV